MTCATPSLDLRTADGSRLTFMRPLLAVECWRALTGFSEDDLLAEIETGKIRFAFNLARRVAGRKERKMYLRVWNRSILCFLNPGLSQPPIDDLSTVLDYILPKGDPIRCVRLHRAFNVSSSHVLNLLEDKFLTPVAVQGEASKSPAVTRESVVRFLTERRIL